MSIGNGPNLSSSIPLVHRSGMLPNRAYCPIRGGALLSELRDFVTGSLFYTFLLLLSATGVTVSTEKVTYRRFCATGVRDSL